MPNGTPLRSDSASRSATPRLTIPRIGETKLSSFSPLLEADEILDQAGAIARLLGIAFEYDNQANHLAAIAGRDAPDFAGLHGDMFRDALYGISSLIAVARHIEDVDRVLLNNARLDKMEAR